MRAARAQGISYKRFKGWEPRTLHEYDENGRLIASRPEVEWDETEQAWMLALDAREQEETCPLCGWPREVCQARETENLLEVPLPTRCHVTTAIKRAQEARGAAGGGKHDDALIWGAKLKAPATPGAPQNLSSGP